MNDLSGKHVVLGLSGGIACYKAAEFCRGLTKAGATVQVVMTESATRFITVATMQALSGRPVYTDQWDERQPNHMPHINLGREADAVVVAPASADFMARLAQGRADDLLSLLCLARPIERVPLLLAPAMNREMWAHPATQRNLAQVRADGAAVLAVGQMNIQRCFLGVCAITVEAGVCTVDAGDAAFKRALRAASRHCVALATNDKLGLQSPHRVAAMRDLDQLVVEHDAPFATLKALAKQGTQILKAQPPQAVSG